MLDRRQYWHCLYISLDRLGLEDNIDTVYNISVDRLGLEDNIDTVYNR